MMIPHAMFFDEYFQNHETRITYNTMKIEELSKRQGPDNNKKLAMRYARLERLLQALRQKEIPGDVAEEINHHVRTINAGAGSDREYGKMLGRAQHAILKIAEQKLRLVARDHYRNMWMSVGMAAFGIPLGVAFGLSMGNMGFLGIGLPIGMAIGIAVGVGMDKKAMQEGRQLDVDI
jgi:hypothetical protein